MDDLDPDRTNPMITPLLGSKEISRQSMELKKIQQTNKESIDKLQIKLKNEFLDRDETLFKDPSKTRKPIKEIARELHDRTNSDEKTKNNEYLGGD